MSLSSGDWANIASAGATTLATVVALGFGLHSIYKANSEAKSKANLAAARISGMLATLSENLSSLIVSREFDDKEEDALKRCSANVAALRKYFSTKQAQPSLELLLMLTNVPNNAAHRIARATDLIEQVGREVLSTGGIRIMFPGTAAFEGYEKRIDGWYNTLSLARNLVDVALRELVKAADIGAPHPKGEELYGGVDDL